MRVKGKIYRAIVLSTLLYEAEADATSAFDHKHNLDGQRDKQGQTRTDRAAMYGRSSNQKESPVIGHLMRMSPDRLQNQIIYSQLSSGRSKRGHPRLRFKDTIKRNLKLRNIKTDSWTSLSQQRDKWRPIVK
ncbi:hypothetical protein NP493_122g06014 [Ridgeia piscesae]|uniref:Uncharacterized protein n=1 Tax=Ridgeia piscesae TaxID=27915 RepID=A0AAD9P698_RIDPI|nr:hypothetical protein NP493_122g06014 [Ridgeia piscesae]